MSERITIGTDPGCDHVVVSEYVSKVHAIVATDEAGQPWLMDAGSTNGTAVRRPGFLGGAIKVVAPYPLHDGDVIIVGRVEIRWPIRRERDAERMNALMWAASALVEAEAGRIGAVLDIPTE